MRKNSVCYNKISVEMLKLLTEFSNYINRISILNDSLLTNSLFNMNAYFIQYVYYFGMGRYYHFRCMGYMESLVLTRCYSNKSLCYWKDDLVMPAHENLMMGFEYLDMLKSDSRIVSDPTFKELIIETEGLKIIGMEIMNQIKSYKLSC